MKKIKKSILSFLSPTLLSIASTLFSLLIATIIYATTTTHSPMPLPADKTTSSTTTAAEWNQLARMLNGMNGTCPSGKYLVGVNRDGGRECRDLPASTTSSPLVHDEHSEMQCTDLGGEVFQNFCKIIDNTCPQGWSPFLNWSTTRTTHCKKTGHTYDNPCIKCSTGQHDFDNLAPEVCTYHDSWVTSTGRCLSPDYSCIAEITSIGCY